MSQRVRLAFVLYALAASAYAVDRVTKVLAENRLAGRPPIVLIPHVVQLSYTTNSGGAFSLLGSVPWLFFAASLAICVVIIASSTRLGALPTAVGLGLLLGGALGNLTDRVVRGRGISGKVVDFIDFHWWPVFNVADACIVVGAAVLVVAGLVGSSSRTRAPEPTTEG